MRRRTNNNHSKEPAIRLLIVVLVCAMFGSFPASANMSSIMGGQTITVDAHGVCKRITNNGAQRIMVPWRTAGEWSAFRTHKPGQIVLTDCEIVKYIAATTTHVVLENLFTSAEWAGSMPKRVVINSGVTVGSTSPATPALRTGTGWGGTLTLDNNGSIQGAGGAVNSGTGGTAVLANVSGLALRNYGTIYSGGGGGGRGGLGGAGTYTQNVVERDPPSGNKGSWATGYAWHYYAFNTYVYWGSQSSYIHHFPYETGSLTLGGWTYRVGTFTGQPGAWSYGIYRERNVPTTMYSTGGAGGNGGRGRGYDGANAGGLAGAAGGTNAGTGGTGGAGGSWGANGATGNTGAAGNNGSGAGGIGGGLSGFAIQNSGFVTLTNSGTIAGRT